jgi:hypothetical protein
MTYVTFWWGDVSRSVVHTMVKGLDIRVLKGGNTRSITGSGCESFAVDGFSLGPLSGGDGVGEEKVSGQVQQGRVLVG